MEASFLEDTVVTLLRLAVTDLPQDVSDGIKRAFNKEGNKTAKSQLKAILDNIELARKQATPICQDTGIQIFYITVGSKFPLLDQIPIILTRAVQKATKEIPLRPNTVNPILHKNPGDNTGLHIPPVAPPGLHSDGWQPTAAGLYPFFC